MSFLPGAFLFNFPPEDSAPAVALFGSADGFVKTSKPFPELVSTKLVSGAAGLGGDGHAM